MKNFFIREVKIGLTFVIAIAILFFGLNYLKGINIFTPSNHYFAKYRNVNGLVTSNPVMIKGYKIGQVRAVKYNFTEQEPFLVEIFVNEDIKLPQGTILTLADEGLLGGKIIEIELGNSGRLHKSGDTLATAVAENLLSKISELAPKLQETFENLDSVLFGVKALVNSKSLHNGINRFDDTMADLNISMMQLKKATANLPATMATLNRITVNLDKKINDFDVAGLMAKINETLANVQSFTEKLNSKNSSIGLLLNDRVVYDNLNTTINSANLLLVDLKEHPKRYVHFSVFGKKDK
jgi:phospholipid/cholesterol/gamma-HCH transport system substrate-binding protein